MYKHGARSQFCECSLTQAALVPSPLPARRSQGTAPAPPPARPGAAAALPSRSLRPTPAAQGQGRPHARHPRPDSHGAPGAPVRPDAARRWVSFGTRTTRPTPPRAAPPLGRHARPAPQAAPRRRPAPSPPTPTAARLPPPSPCLPLPPLPPTRASPPPYAGVRGGGAGPRPRESAPCGPAEAGRAVGGPLRVGAGRGAQLRGPSGGPGCWVAAGHRQGGRGGRRGLGAAFLKFCHGGLERDAFSGVWPFSCSCVGQRRHHKLPLALVAPIGCLGWTWKMRSSVLNT